MNPDTLPPDHPAGLPAPRSLRHALRRPRGRILLAAVILAAVAGWYVTTRGGWVNALRLPPTLDASTPRSQNGWVLEALQLPGEQQKQDGEAFVGFRYENVNSEAGFGPGYVDTADAFGLWLTPPPGDLTAGTSSGPSSNPAKDPFVALARLSTGDTLTLPCQVCSSTEYVPPGETVRPFVFVTLPTGYPNTCRFVDFTLSDRHGHTAHWRVSRLPRMRHAIAPPVKVTDAVTKNGVTMSAHAWYWSSHPRSPMAQAILRPILPANSHQWDVVTLKQERDWEPYAREASPLLYANSGVPILARNGVFDSPNEMFDGGGIRVNGVETPYPRTNNFLKLTTELRQFETYDEPITLHNVVVGHDDYSYCLILTKPFSFTTPSGVTVTLPVQGVEVSKKKLPIQPDRLRVLVRVKPRITFEPTLYSLPNSPLARTYGKPVQLDLQFAPPYRRSYWNNEKDSSPAEYNLSLPHDPKDFPKIPPPPPVLKDFTLIVHQRVDIQAIPMTFTVPIADHAPPTYPKDYKGPRF